MRDATDALLPIGTLVFVTGYYDAQYACRYTIREYVSPNDPMYHRGYRYYVGIGTAFRTPRQPSEISVCKTQSLPVITFKRNEIFALADTLYRKANWCHRPDGKVTLLIETAQNIALWLKTDGQSLTMETLTAKLAIAQQNYIGAALNHNPDSYTRHDIELGITDLLKNLVIKPLRFAEKLRENANHCLAYKQTDIKELCEAAMFCADWLELDVASETPVVINRGLLVMAEQIKKLDRETLRFQLDETYGV